MKKWLESWSFNSKLRIGFVVCAFILVGIGVYSLNMLRKIEKTYLSIATINFPESMEIQEIKNCSDKALSLLLQVNITNQLPTEKTRLEKKFQEQTKDCNEKVESFAKNSQKITDEYERTLNKTLVTTWNKNKEDMLMLIKLAISENPEDKNSFANIYAGEHKKVRDNLYAAREEVLKFQKLVAEEAVSTASELSRKTFMTNSIIVGIGFLFAIAFGFIFSSLISTKLKKISETLNNDSKRITTSSQEVEGTAVSLAESAREQASAVQETVASVTELKEMVRTTNDNCFKTKEMANKNNDSVDEGKKVLNNMVVAVDQVRNSNDQIMNTIQKTNESFNEVLKVINEIASKTKLINDIVFQTKLLSFNASVEAARAGEHGKGFAVVAEEVGKLAQMSGNSANEISKILTSSIETVNSIVNENKSNAEKFMQIAKEKVNESQAVASQCEKIFDRVVENSQMVNSLVDEITMASNEQLQGIEQITKAIEQINMATHSNSTISEEINSASNQIAQQAKGIDSLVEDLNSIVTGKRG